MTRYATLIDTPVERLFAAVDARGALTTLEFVKGRSRRQLEQSAGGEVVWDEDRCRPVADAVRAYFAGDRRALDRLEVDPAGTAFQKEVWRAVRAIPYGRTASYGEIARSIGRPGASRAVGRANGANPICLVVPCHRVIGADGSLTGYGGGLPIKEKLLALEGARHASLQLALEERRAAAGRP